MFMFSNSNFFFQNKLKCFIDRLFISHFVLTDKGKPVELDQKLKSKCELAQKFLSINSDD